MVAVCLTLLIEPITMTTLQLKKDLKSLIDLLDDTSVLKAIHILLQRNVQEAQKADEDFTDEDLAELERRRARYLSGESKPHSVEESMRHAREWFKR